MKHNNVLTCIICNKEIGKKVDEHGNIESYEGFYRDVSVDSEYNTVCINCWKG